MKRQANRCAIKSRLLTGKIRHRPTIRIRLFCQFEPIPTARTWTINLNQLMYSIRSDTDDSARQVRVNTVTRWRGFQRIRVRC